MVNRTANDRSAGVGGAFQEECQEEPKGELDVGEVLFEGSVENWMQGKWDTVETKSWRKKWEWSSDMRDFQEDMTQKSPDTLEPFIHVFATLNGGLTRQRFARRWREELCHALQEDRHHRGEVASENASRSQRSAACPYVIWT